MKNLFKIAAILLLPMGVFAQVDDPFGGDPFGSDDPFGETPSAPAPTPAPQPTTPVPVTQPSVPVTQPVVTTPQPVVTTPSYPTTTQPQPTVAQPAPVATDDPFGSSGGSDDPFASGGADDPFGSSSGDAGGESPFGGSDFGGFGGSAPSGDVLSGLSDSLIVPLRPEFPWEQKSIKERQVLDRYNVREADVFWAKTVWRELDVREKINHSFINPNAPFMTILLDIVKNDPEVKLYAFDPFVSGEFQEETNWQDISDGMELTRTIDVPSMDANGNITTTQQEITDKFNIGSVKKIRFKEVWWFDKSTSRMKVNIMGIAPVKETTLADLGVADVSLDLSGGGVSGSEDPLFWIYYPDIREKLSRYETSNPLNDALRMTWTDLLDARYFSSYIIKASNPLDRSIKDYTKSSLDALYESENIKEQILNFESDLWSY